ncbi:heparan-alpha-glucosaminide N-acetyltransferase domain-containing protein [Microbacterium ulmi]
MTPARRVARNWERLTGPSRIGGIDTARGLAVIGMLAAHLIGLPVPGLDPETWGGVATGRSSILFATLAGVSVALMTGGARPVDGERLRTSSARLAVRALVIFLIGLMLVALNTPIIIILPTYGILFLLAIPLLSVPPRGLAGIAVALGVATPLLWAFVKLVAEWSTDEQSAAFLILGLEYPFVVWIAFLVAGMAVGRLPLRSWRTGLLLVAIGGAVSLVGYGFGHLWREATGVVPGEGGFLDHAFQVDPHSSGMGEVFGSGGFAILVIGLSLLVTRGAVGAVLAPLRALGSMPLTAYSGQIVALAVMQATIEPGNWPNEMRVLEMFVPFTLVTILFCTAWALLVGRGPIEAAVDRFSRYMVPGRPVAPERTASLS